jgi:type IV conjugative transfer system protein TraL
MSENNFTHRFPQYLSRPIQVLWFETDELILCVFTLTLALLYGKIMWLVFLITQYFYTRTKRSKPRGFLKHLLYMFGFIQMNKYPDYFQREFHE